MKKFLPQFVLLLIGAGLLFSVAGSSLQAAPLGDFDKTTLVSGLNEPTAFRFLPDGRILIAEKSGAIKVFHNNILQSEPIIVLATLDTDAADERGLLGIEPDPDYATNGFLYVSYTTASNRDRLSRLTVVNDRADPTSEFVISESNQDGNVYHHGGEVRFGPDGKLYWAVGMNGINPNSQNLSNVHGKIHRFNKDGSIPADNPFYNHPTALKSIWALGLRNPFRFDFLPDGRPVVGDVGGSSWEEVNIIQKGGNYGWPSVEGSCNTCGFANPIFEYPHTPAPQLAGSITATLHYTGTAFPSEFKNVLFYGDYSLGFIRYLVFDESYQSVISDKEFDNDAGTVVQLSQGPDGNVYQMNIYPGEIYKIAPASGNRAPKAKAEANITAELAPLEVIFSSAGTSDPDGQTLSYHWDFKDGQTSSEPNPTHTFTANGTYDVTLTVSDGSKEDTATVTVTVGNRTPAPVITSPSNNSQYNAGDTINYSGTATDPEDGELPASAFSWKFVFHHAEHTHPFLSVVNGVKSGQFTIPTGNDNAYNTWYRVELTVTDSGGLKKKSVVDVKPNLVNITIKTNPTNLAFSIDGIPYTNTHSEQAVVGVKRVLSVLPKQYLNGEEYIWSDWSNSMPPTHVITTPPVDTTFEATFLPSQGTPPAPWVATDVGSVAFQGHSTYENGVYTLWGSGGDIWGTADEFHYLHQSLNGDGEIIARVLSQTNTDGWAKAGVMIKQSPTAGSPYAMMAVTPENGLNFQYNFSGQSSGGNFNFPVWIKLNRSGNSITASSSSDGSTWNVVGTTNLALPDTVDIGLFVLAHNQQTISRTVFDNVTVQSTIPNPWQQTSVGTPTVTGSARHIGDNWEIKGAGDDIWGTVDQFHYVYQPLNGDGEISAQITSQTNTDGWAKAGVMIKQSPTAGSPYAMMAVTPENGYAFQYSNFGNVNGASYTFPNAWLKLKREGTNITSYYSNNGTDWIVVGTRQIDFTGTVTVGLFVTSHNGSQLSTVKFSKVNVSPLIAPTLPSGWQTSAIGSPTLVGEATEANGVFTLVGGGDDIWGTTDQFRYAYQTLAGNGEIKARITSQTNTDGWAKAGVMFKETPTSGSKYVFMGVTPSNGYAMQYSNFGNINGSSYTFPNAWVKLTRQGDLFTTHYSIDGQNWLPMGTTEIPMTNEITVGLFVTSHNGRQTSTVKFDNVTISTTPANPLPTGWQKTDIGNPAIIGTAEFSNNTFTVTGSGEDIWGTLDQFQYAFHTLSGDGQITAKVLSQTNTDGWAKAGVMIKQETTAGSPYALMAITPSNGFAFQHTTTTHVSGGTFTLPNAWVRLARTGNTITAYKSANGTDWVLVGSTTLTLPTDITFGLFVTSHNGSQISTAQFSDVAITP